MTPAERSEIRAIVREELKAAGIIKAPDEKALTEAIIRDDRAEVRHLLQGGARKALTT